MNNEGVDGTMILKTKSYISAVAAFTILFSLSASARPFSAKITSFEQHGIASVYSGGRTANGERAIPTGLTAAHRSLPFGTLVKVTHARNGRSVVVRVNDRGPFIRGRVIDITPAAARVLGFSGLASVRLAVLTGAE
jgi:rare lipoprotein A